MEWLSQNWVWVLFAGGMIAMHLFGHGCHGDHDKHGHKNDSNPPGKDSVQGTPKQGSAHKH